MSEINRFNLVRNGYDCYQVDNELDRLNFQIQSLNEKIVMYQNQIDNINNNFVTLKKRYQMLVSELSMKEKAADDVARIALKEANAIFENAQSNADKIIQQSIVDAQAIIEQVQQYNDESFAQIDRIKEELMASVEKLNSFAAVEIPNIEVKQ
ncbi:MAG: DivIVA domain-containing protein [Erysipelotrichaceae bacterium]|nr:DivIVA domain-containing protein [Erysipelotrichaceae bacterium]